MARPITLFTGQWADLPLEEVARLASEWGYDGLEIACWGDHLDPWRWDDDDYVAGQLELLERHGLKVWAISNHLKGQAVCDDPIDQRHRDICPDRVWGDGDPEGVRQRAAEEMKNTARLAAKLGVQDGHRLHRLLDLEVRGDVPAGLRRRRSRPATRTSPTAGTRSSTCSTRSACGSPTRCTLARSPTTTGPRCGRWRRSATARRSA